MSFNNLLPFESFAMENPNLPSLEEGNASPQNEEISLIKSAESRTLQLLAGAQNSEQAPAPSNQAPIGQLVSQGSGPYNNPDGYVDTARGPLHASIFVPNNVELAERHMVKADTLESQGRTHGAILNYKQVSQRCELADQAMKIDLYSSFDPVSANKFRSELSDIIQRQESEDEPYNLRARDKAIKLNIIEPIQTESKITRTKTAVIETLNDPRFQTAVSLAQAPIAAVAGVALKCTVEHYINNHGNG